MATVKGVMDALEGMRRPAWVSEEAHRFALAETATLLPDALWNGTRSLRALQGLAVWAPSGGYPLDLDVLLQPEVLERYAAFRTREVKARRAKKSVRDEELSRLRAIAAERAKRRYVAQVRSESSKRLPRTPYTKSEVWSLVRAGRLLEDPAFRRTYLSIVALGAGAGLTPAEIHDARIEDLRTDGRTLWIAPRSDLRKVAEVPVAQPWADVLREALSIEKPREDGRILATGPYRSGLDDFLRDRADKSDQLRVSLSRLRAAWMLQRVEAGARLDEILRYAGLKSAEPLRFIVPLAKARSDAAIRRAFG